MHPTGNVPPSPHQQQERVHSSSIRSSSSSLRLIRDSASTMFERVMGRKRRDDYHSNTTTAGSRHYHTAAPSSNDPNPTQNNTTLIHSIREEEVGGGDLNHHYDDYDRQYNRMDPNHHERTSRGGGCGGWRRSSGNDALQQQQQQKYSKMIRSSYWNMSMILFAVVLLFGDSIRTIVLPPFLDNTMDAIFVVTILFFLYDIYIRICMIDEENYFTIPAFVQQYRLHKNPLPLPPVSSSSPLHNTNNNNTSSSSSSHHIRSNHHPDPARRFTWMEILQQIVTCGSFLFWCDLLSTLALLYDITWINAIQFRETFIQITLDPYGIPTDGLDEINQARTIELDPKLLVTILQSARVARFIRSGTAVKISSKVNWFYLLNLCNPIWWFQQLFCINSTKTNSILCCRRHHNHNHDNGGTLMQSSRHGSGAVSLLGGVSASASLPGSSSSPTNIADHGQQRLSTTSSSVMENNNNNNYSSTNNRGLLHKQSSWATLGQRAVLATRMKNGPASHKNNNFVSRAFSQWFLGERSLSTMSVQGDAMRNHLAAVRIQRAWRAVKQQQRSPSMNMVHDDINSGEFSDVAWKGRMSHSTINPSLTNSVRMMTTSIPSKSSRVVQSAVTTTTSHLTSAVSTAAATATATVNSLNDVNYNYNNKRRNESQVGSAMRELTGQRVAIGIIVALLLTVIFTYTEEDATRPTTMIVLHSQTKFDAFATKALNAARMTAVPDLFSYELANGEIVQYDVVENGRTPSDLRPSERLRITILTVDVNDTTTGSFSVYSERREEAVVTILSTLFIVLLWFFGVTAFAGPVMVLVVIPIERMVRLLGMLMVDPLGYQSTSRYKRFVDEESEITKNTRWTKEILKGMETSFLMSTILRIGSLMKVGFGSAGVEIIRNNLEKGQSKNMLILSSQGSTVSCIFLFCDIRNFTDATECLQEEVFVFTNRIAAVVHSNVHSYGGSANKNVGDAFLLSWLLDEDPTLAKHDNFSSQKRSTGSFSAKNNQADKCLLSVVRICMALYHDDYYIGAMTESAREALVMKLQHRKGPIVQMGFGMHAGRAVQGAIGSQRKIDATYVSEAVERAEFLESSTKRYGLPMLMSDSFHRLLHPSNRRRCRKIDQILIQEDYDDDNEEDDKDTAGDIMELFTFDIDVASLWAKKSSKVAAETSTRDGNNNAHNEGSASDSSRRGTLTKQPRENRRSSNNGSTFLTNDSDELNSSSLFLGPNSANNNNNSNNPSLNNNPIDADGGGGTSTHSGGGGDDPNTNLPPHRHYVAPTLVLPTGPALYNANVWTSDDMRTMRQLYSDGLFFQNFMSGLQSYYAKDWEHATQCFTTILQRFEDGPSRYFLSRIEEHNGIPPKDFVGYGIP